MTTPVLGRTYLYPHSNSTDFSLIETPIDIQTLILRHLINMNNSHHFIPFLFLTCKTWYHIINHDSCISLAKTLFAIKNKTDGQLSQIPDDVCKNFPEEEFAPQEFKLIDRIYHLYPKSFTILLNYPSALFGENSLYLSLLHRYEWKIEEVVNSKNANIRSIAYQQLQILMSFVKLSLLLNQDKRSLEKNQIEKWDADWQENVNYLENHCHVLYPKPDCGLIRRYYSYYSFASIAFAEAKTKSFCLNFFKCCGISFEKLFLDFPKDREIVLTAVSQNGQVLQYAAESFKSDPEIVLTAVSRNGLALQYAAESLKIDRDIVLAAIKKFGKALQYAAENIKNNPEIVLAAVEENGLALQYAAESLKSDREIVLAAVEENGLAFQYAAESLKSDFDIVLAAVKEYGYALGFANECFKSKREIVLAAVSKSSLALQYADKSLKSDREIVLAAVSESGQALQYAAENLKNDRKIVLAAVSQNGDALQYAAESLISDPEVVLAAVKKNCNAFFYAHRNFQNENFLLKAIQQLFNKFQNN